MVALYALMDVVSASTASADLVAALEHGAAQADADDAGGVPVPPVSSDRGAGGDQRAVDRYA